MQTQYLLLPLALLLAMGCGPSDSTGEGLLPNGDPLPDGLVQTADGYQDSEGRNCNDPTPCGDCDFDCKPAGNPYRVPGPIGPQDQCAQLAVQLTEAIPTVVLLVDQSGSMTADFGGNQDRWEATHSSLMDPTNGLVSTLQDRFRFGFALYTSYDGGPTCPDLRDVRPDFNNFEAINRVFSNAKPEEDTPTGASIIGTMRQFEDKAVRGPKILLLATDGEPDTCDIPDPRNENEREIARQESISAVEEAFSRGVETVVLSVGDQVGEKHLDDMATAGMGGVPSPFFRATNPEQLKTTLEKIIVGSRECIFQLDGAILDPKLATHADIQVNGTAVPYGDTGWVFHQDEQTCFGAKQCVELKGAACDTIQRGDAQVGGNFLCAYGDPNGDNGYGTAVPGTLIPGDGTITGIPGANNTTGGPNNTTGGPNNTTGGPNTTPGTNGMCTNIGESCSYDGDCCTGLCGRSGSNSACVAQ
jgi:hypothetical protein